jgi:hypothetical protein
MNNPRMKFAIVHDKMLHEKLIGPGVSVEAMVRTHDFVSLLQENHKSALNPNSIQLSIRIRQQEEHQCSRKPVV